MEAEGGRDFKKSLTDDVEGGQQVREDEERVLANEVIRAGAPCHIDSSTTGLMPQLSESPAPAMMQR